MMKYCYECGHELVLKECFNCGISEGYVQYCNNCNEFRFPFFNVAVSVVIYNKDCSKTLLIKQYKRDWNILVAGYVNKKETLEEALRREIMEETSLKPFYIQYNNSKYFEKSNSLICNFIACVEKEEFKLTQEVDYAAWYSLEEANSAIMQGGLAEYFYKISLSKIQAPAIEA